MLHTFHKSIITNMATARIFEVISNKFNIHRLYISVMSYLKKKILILPIIAEVCNIYAIVRNTKPLTRASFDII